MNFNRTLLLSATMHIWLGYMLLNHAPDRLAPAMTTPELAHFIQVRLQLAATTSESLPVPQLVEETAAVEQEQPQDKDLRPTPAKPKPLVKKLSATPKMKIVKKRKLSPRNEEIQTVKQRPVTAVVHDVLTQAADSSTSDALASVSETSTPQAEKQTASRQTTQTAPLSKRQRRSLKQAYWSNLTRFFKANGYQYPKRAILAGQEGKVYIIIEIDPSGRIVDARIGKSSGFPLLDNSALAAVLATKRVPPLPERLKRRNHKFRIPIEYRLPS